MTYKEFRNVLSPICANYKLVNLYIYADFILKDEASFENTISLAYEMDEKTCGNSVDFIDEITNALSPYNVECIDYEVLTKSTCEEIRYKYKIFQRGYFILFSRGSYGKSKSEMDIGELSRMSSIIVRLDSDNPDLIREFFEDENC